MFRDAMTVFYVTIPLTSRDTIRKTIESSYLDVSVIDKILKERERREIYNLK